MTTSLPKFSGNPALYKKICWLGSIAIHLYLYGAYVGIQYFVNDDLSALALKPILITLASTLFLALQGYRWIMRLDAQYGRGSGWALNSTLVKLPELKQRPKKG